MPPWKADPGDGPFIGQHPLSAAELSLLAALVRCRCAGRPRRRADPQSAIRNPQCVGRRVAAWETGSRHHAAAAVHVPAEGTDAFHIFVLPIPVDRARFVRGLEFRPGNARVVHHANIRIDTTPASRALDAADPGPGYDGLIARSATYPDGHFLGWTPGQVAPLLPNDLAWRLDTEHRPGRRAAHAAERETRAGGAVDRPLLRRHRAGAHAGDAAARAAGHRHSRGRRQLHGHRLLHAAGRCRVGGGAAARALPRARRAGRGDAAGRFEETAHRHRRLGFPLAARLPFRDAAAPPERDAGVDALHLRQLRRERAQSAAAAGARPVGTAVGGRDGRPLAAGAAAQRPRSRSPQPRFPAEGRRGRRQGLRSGD